jgi:hypothetical protein
MSLDPVDGKETRRDLLGGLLLSAGLSSALTGPADARDYRSRREALDDLDRLASVCGMRLGTVRTSRADADLLVSRFLEALRRHRVTRDQVRRQFALPKGVDPASEIGSVEAELPGLRQALDDLMIAYAESLPVFADASVVARLAVLMVEVSKLRTVIDLWVEAESS